MRFKIKKTILIYCLFLYGCSTYGSGRYTTDIFKNYQVENNGLSVRLDPIIDKEKSMWYLNLPPAKYDLLPVFIAVTNISNSIKKIDVDEAYLMDGLKRNEYESLSVEKTVKMLQSSGWIPSLLFGITGSAIASSVEQSKDDNLYRKAFKPRILNPAGKGEGAIFFRVSKNSILNKEFILYLAVEDLTSSSTEKMQIPFKTGTKK